MSSRKLQTPPKRNQPTARSQGGRRTPAQKEPTRDMIARRAYEIWESRGCPAGSGVEDWLIAEAELIAAGRFRVGSREQSAAPRKPR